MARRYPFRRGRVRDDPKASGPTSSSRATLQIARLISFEPDRGDTTFSFGILLGRLEPIVRILRIN